MLTFGFLSYNGIKQKQMVLNICPHFFHMQIERNRTESFSSPPSPRYVTLLAKFFIKMIKKT